jgi:hypothetical protein
MVVLRMRIGTCLAMLEWWQCLGQNMEPFPSFKQKNALRERK